MANNPLYPGYRPKKEDEQNPSPSYPGYYPGKPLQRRPGSKDFLQPIEYDFDKQMEYIDDYIGNGLPNAYRWVRERIVDDFKSELKATIKPAGLSASELDDYDVSDMPGAVGVSLDLSKVTKPKELLSELAKSGIRKTLNIDLKEPLSSDFGDFKIGVEKKLWKQTLLPEKQRGKDFSLDKAVEEAYKTSTLAQYAGQSYSYKPKDKPPPNPLDLSTANIKEGPSKQYKDVYKETADAFIDFQANKGITSQRDKQYRKYQEAAIHAVDLELKQKRSYIENIDPSALATLDLFHTQANIANDMSTVGKGITGFSKELGKSLVGNPKSKINKELSDLAGSGGLIENKLKQLEKHIDNARKAGVSKEALGMLTKETEDYKQYLLNAQNLFNGVSAGELSSQAYLKKLRIKLNSLTGNGKELTTANPYTEGIQDLFLRKTTERHLQGTDYVLKGLKPVKVENSLANILENPQFDTLDLHARKLRPLSLRAQLERSGYSFEEAFEDITSGKFAEKIAWNKILKPKISSYLPSTALASALKKRHYFGLIIDEDRGLTRRQIKRFERLGFVFKNTFKINVDNKDWKIVGGDHFEFFGSKGVKDTVSSIQNLQGPAAKEDYINKLLEGSISPLNKEDALKFAKFEAWAKRKFGKKYDDPKFRKELFDKLFFRNNNDKLTLDITRAYRGLLEKYWEVLNGIQKKLLKSDFFRNVINPIIKFRTLLTERIASFMSEWTAKILAALGAGATSGLSILLSKLIKQIIRPIINYIAKKVGSFAKGLLQADWQAVFKEIDKEVQNTIKAVMAIASIPIIIIFVFIIFISVIVGTGQTPLDPTSSNIGYGDDFQYDPANENKVVKVEKDVFVTLGNGTVLENPDSITNEEAQNATFRYVVTITPKITITDGSVSYIDIAKWLADSGATSTFFSSGAMPIASEGFVSGQDIVVNIPGDFGVTEEFSMGSSWRDRLVMNSIYVNTPAVPSINEEPGVAVAGATFKIGNYTSKCPLVALDGSGTQILTISYNGSIGHGSESYWRGLSSYYCPIGKCTNDDCESNPESCYAWPIPYVWYKGACPSGHACRRDQPFYGYALDVSALSNAAGPDATLVVFPHIAPSWTVLQKEGNGLIIESTDKQYKVYFGHIVPTVSGGTYNAGDDLGYLHRTDGGAVPHIHIEVINMTIHANNDGQGTPVKPDDFFADGCRSN